MEKRSKKFESRHFQEIVKQSEADQLGFKYRLFLRLFQLHWWDAVIAIRKKRAQFER